MEKPTCLIVKSKRLSLLFSWIHAENASYALMSVMFSKAFAPQHYTQYQHLKQIEIHLILRSYRHRYRSEAIQYVEVSCDYLDCIKQVVRNPREILQPRYVTKANYDAKIFLCKQGGQVQSSRASFDIKKVKEAYLRKYEKNNCIIRLQNTELLDAYNKNK